MELRFIRWLSHFRQRAADALAMHGRFRLLRYFTVTSLGAFAAVAIAFYFLQRAEETFFEAAQHEQANFFAQAQAELVREQTEAARNDLLMVHEGGHITLTRVFANAMWDTHFAPLVAKAQRLPIEHCRGLGKGERPACFAELGRKITSLPGFADIDVAVHAMTKKTSVFKIKVYDLRGITVYSSELAQIGEDKADNKGWKDAVRGQPASELVHRDRFSAFEGTVENRDLIQSYIPVLSPADGTVAGVFEIYSDVTPFLKQIEAAAARITAVTAANQARVENVAAEKQREVESNTRTFFMVIGGLLALLYVALLLLVRNAQRIIDEQARAREEAALRERLWHREKMAALATMAENVSHEVGNPLQVISGLAQEIAHVRAAGETLGNEPQMILEQTSRLEKMTRQITEFAAARRETSEALDINRMVKSLCDFFGFDRRYRDMHFETRLSEDLPACIGVPDHVNEVLMSLLQAHAEASENSAASAKRVLVETAARGKEVMVRIGCKCDLPGEACGPGAADWRLESARLRVEGMGGRLKVGLTTDIFLPL